MAGVACKWRPCVECGPRAVWWWWGRRSPGGSSAAALLKGIAGAYLGAPRLPTRQGEEGGLADDAAVARGAKPAQCRPRRDTAEEPIGDKE
ncbi:hypothetical protein NDU88_009619 [Pleurodeles waltl]|uniref:Uncharacterized protein n=1 Tax=Pleurodeles waltl TaxID=8319 RepID=A0AAV7QS52_PLEWA|nr:hypothetical protein NDU88_009619 [Pleurodeles waltl]